ncbi:MAG: class II fructose-bisphosphate aldolase [Treponemataceae bacterium]
MSISNSKSILIKAAKGKYAVGAFNITSISQLQAVVEASEAARSPLIIQTSVGTVEIMGTKLLVSAFRAIAEDVSIPVALHLDHCTDVEFCKKCIDAGYTSIMYDGSKKSFEENIRTTAEVVAYARKKGDISVEGELGTVSGVEDQIKVAENEAELCNPVQAVRYVAESGVDLFAPAIGTAHGIYTTENPKIDVDRLGNIGKLLAEKKLNVPLVVHGGTGLKEDLVVKLIAAGAAKYNVSTELKHVWLDGAWEYLQKHLTDYNPSKMAKEQKKKTAEAIAEWIRILGSKDKA